MGHRLGHDIEKPRPKRSDPGRGVGANGAGAVNLARLSRLRPTTALGGLVIRVIRDVVCRVEPEQRRSVSSFLHAEQPV